jgi:hypothetical protein
VWAGPFDLDPPHERIDRHDGLGRDQPPAVQTRRPDDQRLRTTPSWVDDDGFDARPKSDT